MRSESRLGRFSRFHIDRWNWTQNMPPEKADFREQEFKECLYLTRNVYVMSVLVLGLWLQIYPLSLLCPISYFTETVAISLDPRLVAKWLPVGKVAGRVENGRNQVIFPSPWLSCYVSGACSPLGSMRLLLTGLPWGYYEHSLLCSTNMGE